MKHLADDGYEYSGIISYIITFVDDN